MNLWTSKFTTTGGFALLIAAIGGALQAHFDGNPATEVDWNLVIIGLVSGINGLLARDNGTTSEQAGAKTDRRFPLP